VTWSETRYIVIPDSFVSNSDFNVLTFNNTYNPPRTYWWGVRDVSILADCSDCIPLPDTGAYGRILGADQSHIEEVNYSFEAVSGDVPLFYEVWDVDFFDEVEILVNDVQLDYVAVTANETWSGSRFIILPDELVSDIVTNVITFNNTFNPPKTYWWGVRNVSIYEGCTDCISLPDAGSYGMISDGDQTHPDQVDYVFEGAPGAVSILYEAWDVDFADEVEILINGVPLEYTPTTPNVTWGETHHIAIPDLLVLDTGPNTLTFNNTYNPPKTYWWGVRVVSVSKGCIPLPDSGAYGNISGGDQTHVEQVNYSMEGTAGDMEISYEVWDVDIDGEVEIYVNHVAVGLAEATANATWSTTRSVVLPDGYVDDAGVNILTFSNCANPPNSWWWGVREVSVVE
jgi:hypothetical protein